ncbi:hypothetical protein LEP1GSC080_1012 [Leptospira interrogans str. FPW2026]|nr:hypothetical protein LEP1GSC080_1012 [Leptospira interrogans str. FPW2026]
MNSTERAFYGSPFWAQKRTFFKCSDKNEVFYLQKVCFSDREKFSEPYRPPNTHPKIGKTQHNALYESRWKTQHNALYESRWKTQHNALYESRCGWELSFTEDLS